MSSVVSYMTVCSNATELIGRTPLVELDRIAGGDATVIAKLEFYNPVNPVKDRTGAAIIEATEVSGELRPGGIIVEGTFGNTGITLAMVGAAKGYKVVPTIPEIMSLERRTLLRAYGAELVLTPGPPGMKEVIAKAKEVAGERGGILARQLASPASLVVYRRITAEKIWADTDGKVDIFVAGVGTGDTVSRVDQAFKEHKPEVEITTVEPAESPIPPGGQPGPHKIQGFGTNFVPEIPDRDVIDEVITRSIDQSTGLVRAAATQEGLLVGISPGATLSAAVEIANRPENASKTIVTVLPDFGERYLFTILFEGLVDA